MSSAKDALVKSEKTPVSCWVRLATPGDQPWEVRLRALAKIKKEKVDKMIMSQANIFSGVDGVEGAAKEQVFGRCLTVKSKALCKITLPSSNMFSVTPG